jgi:hypothetical protein
MDRLWCEEFLFLPLTLCFLESSVSNEFFERTYRH